MMTLLWEVNDKLKRAPRLEAEQGWLCHCVCPLAAGAGMGPAAARPAAWGQLTAEPGPGAQA